MQTVTINIPEVYPPILALLRDETKKGELIIGGGGELKEAILALAEDELLPEDLTGLIFDLRYPDGFHIRFQFTY